MTADTIRDDGNGRPDSKPSVRETIETSLVVESPAMMREYRRAIEAMSDQFTALLATIPEEDDRREAEVTLHMLVLQGIVVAHESVQDATHPEVLSETQASTIRRGR